MNEANYGSLMMQIATTLFTGIVLFVIGAWWQSRRARARPIEVSIEDPAELWYLLDLHNCRVFASARITYRNRGRLENTVELLEASLLDRRRKKVGNLRLNAGPVIVKESSLPGISDYHATEGGSPFWPRQKDSKEPIRIPANGIARRLVWWITDRIEALPDPHSELQLVVCCTSVAAKTTSASVKVRHLGQH